MEQKRLKNRVFFTIILIVCSLFLNSCVTFRKNIKVENINIDNQVEKCIEINPLAVMYKSGSVYLNTKWKKIKSTGFCGCKSALLSYKVIAKSKNAKSTVHYSDFSSLDHDDFDFLVYRDFKQDYDLFVIYIQCKNSK